MRPRYRRSPVQATNEIIEWMRKHTIADLKTIAVETERSGGDASSVRRLLTDLETLRIDSTVTLNREVMVDEVHMLPR